MDTSKIPATAGTDKPPPLDPIPAPVTLPEGLHLPDGRIVLYAPHRACECETCRAAFDAHDAGLLELPGGRS